MATLSMIIFYFGCFTYEISVDFHIGKLHIHEE